MCQKFSLHLYIYKNTNINPVLLHCPDFQQIIHLALFCDKDFFYQILWKVGFCIE